VSVEKGDHDPSSRRVAASAQTLALPKVWIQPAKPE
jgi:hypothetical protein